MSTTASKAKLGAAGVSLAALIIAAVIDVEGGYVNDPADPGGETNHGITVEVARQSGYTGSMKDLPKEFAQKIYFEDYITKPGFFPLVEMQPAVAHKMVDAGVNVGTSRPSRWLQLTLNTLSRGGADYPILVVDGKVGTSTINAYASLAKKRGEVKACELVIKMLDAHQANYYASLNMPSYQVGWIDNRIGNVPLSKCKDYQA